MSTLEKREEKEKERKEVRERQDLRDTYNRGKYYKISSGLLECTSCKLVGEWDRCKTCDIVPYCSKECIEKNEETHARECAVNSLIAPQSNAKYSINNLGNIGNGAIAMDVIESGEVIMTENPNCMIIGVNTSECNDNQRDLITGDCDLEGLRYVWSQDQKYVKMGIENESDLVKLAIEILDKNPRIVTSGVFRSLLTHTIDTELNHVETISRIHFENEHKESDDDEEKIMQRKKKCKIEASLVWGVLRVNSVVISTEFGGGWLGTGFFPRLSVFNHCCNPNAHYTFSNGTLTLQSLRKILPGEEITFDYIGESPILPRSVRASILSKGFRFSGKCMCSECTYDKGEDMVKESDDPESPLVVPLSENDVAKDEYSPLIRAGINVKNMEYEKAYKILIEWWIEKKEILLEHPCTLCRVSRLLLECMIHDPQMGCDGEIKPYLFMKKYGADTHDIFDACIKITCSESFYKFDDMFHVSTLREITHLKMRVLMGYIMTLEGAASLVTIGGENPRWELKHLDGIIKEMFIAMRDLMQYLSIIPSNIFELEMLFFPVIKRVFTKCADFVADFKDK